MYRKVWQGHKIYNVSLTYVEKRSTQPERYQSMTKNNFHKAVKITTLPVTGEFIKDPQGRLVPVLDLAKISTESAVLGRKKEPTKVLCVPDAGIEGITQNFEGRFETYPRDANPGEALFVNSPTDMYVPPNANKSGRLMFDELEKNGYKIVQGNEKEAIVLSPASRLLLKAVDARVCIKHAWGDPGPDASEADILQSHQFLSEGATLKVGNSGMVISGIDKEGMAKWGDENGNDFGRVESKAKREP